MTKDITRLPREGEREVIAVEDMRSTGRQIEARKPRMDDGPLMDPIRAELEDAERAASMPSRAGASADALLFEPVNKPYRSVARVVSFADGPIDPEKASLHQTIRVDVDGAIEYGSSVGPHDGRVKRTFI